LALTAVNEAGSYNLEHIVDVIIGKKTHEVTLSDHHKLKSFGKGKAKEPVFWKSVLRSLLVHGYLTKNIENYGLLFVNEKGEAYLKKPTKLEMAVDQQFDAVYEDDDNVEVENVFDEVLYDMLKDLTRKVGKQMNLPPYVIFSEPSLEEMAFKYPITIDEMSKVSGVNKNKAMKFGKPFIELIKKYVEDNNIERSEDVIIKSVVNKSAKKIAIITNIDKKQNLEDIARSQGMTMPELLNEIQSIVTSGTKLQLEPYVNNVADEEIQDEMMNFFRGCQTDSLDEALKEYGEEFSKEDIQLMKIYFLSEMAF